ncbi:MAG: AEC family transporter [Fretibacterium sp.]|nr:AEC family transporter [Fretibacterium sp.]
MELASITFWQVCILFVLIFTGLLCAKMRIFSPEAKSVLSNMLVYLIMPAMALNSYLADYDPEVSKNIFRAFSYSIALNAAAIGLTFLLNRDRGNPKTPICRLACIFSNAGYMGYPLIQALYGTEGLMYASVYVTLFNFLLWTLGVRLMNRQHEGGEAGRILKNPVIWAVVLGLMIYYLRIPVPQIVRAPLKYIGDMNTPISMMITGMLLAEGNVSGILRDALLWRTVTIRLLIIPAVCVAVFFALGVRDTVAQVTLLQEACPCAAITSVFAVQFHYDEGFAGALVIVSTLLSIVTLPVCALLLTM